MPEKPKKAPAAVLEQIVDALRDPQRWFLDQASSFRNYLTLWELRADGFIADLADGLEREGRLFYKPKTHQGQARTALTETPSGPPLPSRSATPCYDWGFVR